MLEKLLVIKYKQQR